MRLAAVIGEWFSMRILGYLIDLPSEKIAAHLSEMIDRQFLIAVTAAEEEQYLFKHDLLRDAIYATLLKKQRESLHDQVAVVIRENSDIWPANRNQLLAHHFLRGRDKQQAIPYLLEAAEEAILRSAYETAGDNFQQLLTLLEKSGNVESELYLRAQIGLGQTKKLLGEYDAGSEILSAALQSLLRWSLRTKPLTLLQVMVKGFREIADIHLRKAEYPQAISLSGSRH